MSDTLEHRLTKLETEQGQQGKRLGEIEADIKNIVKMLSERPTWLIAGFVTTLTSITVGLIVYVLTHH